MEKVKQYLLLVDERMRGILGSIIPGIMYVEVEGMEIKEQPERLVLTTMREKQPDPASCGVDADVSLDGIPQEQTDA